MQQFFHTFFHTSCDSLRPVTVQSKNQHSRNCNLVFCLYTIGLLFITGCSGIAEARTMASAQTASQPGLSGFTCSSASMSGTGTDLCTVTISGPAPAGGFRVALASNNAAAAVPTASMVAANATSAQFKVSVTPVSAVQVATLTATAASGTANFALQLNLPTPTLSISATSVAFGNVVMNSVVARTVTLTSSGTGPLTVTGATVSGAGFTLTSTTFPMTLNPGQTATLSVAFDPTAVGAATGQLTVSSNSSAAPAAIALSGTGVAQLSGFSCSSASMSGTGTDICSVTISQPAPAGGFRITLSSNNAAVTVPTVVVVAANSTTAQVKASVTPVSTAQVANLSASDGTVTKSFALQLNLPVPTLSIGASSMAFGTVAVNAAATQSVTLTSSGTGPVTVSGATVTGAGFALKPTTFPMTLNPGQTATLSVEFDPTAPGAAAGQLTVSSNSSVATAAIPLSGTGGAQLSGFSCSKASMSGSGTDVCTVTISEPAPAGGFRITLASNNTFATIPTVSMVAANATSAQFSVNVTPVSSAQVATLTASAGSVTENFALQLNLPVPTLGISATSVTFGNVAVATTATQTVTLTSSGTEAVTVSAATVTGTGFALAPTTFPLTLNPGQTATLSVLFDPTAMGASTGQLTVSSNSSVATAAIPLSGTGGAQLSGFTCAITSMTGAGTDTCTATISEPAPAGGFRVGLASNNAAAPIGPASMVAANATSTQFTFSVSAVATAQVATLTASGGNVTQTVALQLNAAFPVLSIGAAGAAFGNVAVNVPVTQTITLNSTGTAPLTISGAVVTGTGFTLASSSLPVTLNPGQSASLGVQFDPAAAGLETGQLTVTSNSPSGTAVIPLTGTGAASGTFSYSGSPIESTLAPPNPATPISADFFGMTILHTNTPFPDFPVSTFRFWDAAPWATVETASGVYDWSHVDTAISIGQANGISDYIYTFGDVPTWASTNPTAPCTGGSGPGTCAPPNMAAFESFATAVVQRYCGTIKYYETWNEPNNPPYWSGTNGQLLNVAQDLYQIAKDPANCGCTNGSCSPNNGGANPNQVLMPPISKVTTANLSWLDSYLGTTGPTYPYADVAAFHGYGTTTDADPEQIVSQVQSLNQTLANHGLANLQLWNTEASWGSPASVDQTEGSWLMRYHVTLALSGVSRFVWYAYDNCGWGTLWEAPWCANPQMPVGQLTAPGEAYPVIENWLSGANLENCQVYENGLWVCELERPGNYSAWMVWSSTGTDIDVPIPANSGLMVYRDWQNNLNSLSTDLTVGEMPVLLGNLNP
jgi:hypothetical protein